MRLYTYEYDQTYEPATPTAPVQIISLVTGRTAGPFPAVIDSGAELNQISLTLNGPAESIEIPHP